MSWLRSLTTESDTHVMCVVVEKVERACELYHTNVLALAGSQRQSEAVRTIPSLRRELQLSYLLVLVAVNTCCDTEKLQAAMPATCAPSKPPIYRYSLLNNPTVQKKQRLQVSYAYAHAEDSETVAVEQPASTSARLTLPSRTSHSLPGHEEPGWRVDHALALAPTAEVAAAAPVADDSVNRGGSMAYPW